MDFKMYDIAELVALCNIVNARLLIRTQQMLLADTHKIEVRRKTVTSSSFIKLQGYLLASKFCFADIFKFRLLTNYRNYEFAEV